jgi:hypothetical protein
MRRIASPNSGATETTSSLLLAVAIGTPPV